jgi:hypothetical protein
MGNHEVEITISKTGEVRVHVKGAKGKACMEYAKWLTKIIGEVKDQKLTSEFYEPETKAAAKIEQKLNNGNE